MTPDLKVEAAYQEADALIRAKRYPEAAARATEALPKAAAGAPKERLNLIVLAAKAAGANPQDGVTAIEAEIAKTKDGAVRAAGFVPESAEVKNLPKTLADVPDVDTGRKVMKLLDALEDNDDVQNVYTNANITEEMANA